MRIAITGTTGRVGQALSTYFTSQHEVLELPRSKFDLANPCQMKSVLENLECDLFLHPASITSLEACEDDPALAWQSNATAPAQIADWASARNIPLVHFSTDYVFSGEEPGLKSETMPTGPLSRYAESKLAGEEAVLAHPNHLVLRVSWVFGPEKPSFIDSIVRKALAGEPLSAIADKFSLPTSTQDLPGWVEGLITSEATGLFHLCQSGTPVSWHGMAEEAIDELVQSGRLTKRPDIQATLLTETAEFRAIRPRHTAMDTTKLSRHLQQSPRPWQDALRAYLRECR